MVLGRSVFDSYVLNVDGMKIMSTGEVDNKLTFKNHVD